MAWWEFWQRKIFLVRIPCVSLRGSQYDSDCHHSNIWLFYNIMYNHWISYVLNLEFQYASHQLIPQYWGWWTKNAICEMYTEVEYLNICKISAPIKRLTWRSWLAVFILVAILNCSKLYHSSSQIIPKLA